MAANCCGAGVRFAGGSRGRLLVEATPDTIAAEHRMSNGRMEADEIDIDTKYAGRIAQSAPELGRKQEYCSATSTLSPSHAISLRRQIPLPDVYPLE